MQKIRKHLFENRRLLVWISWLLVTIVIAGLLLFILWTDYIKPRPKLITGINLYKFPVHLSVGSEEMDLQSFDSFRLYVDTTSPFQFTVTNMEGQLLLSKEFNYGHDGILALELLSANSEVKRCMIQADVTDLFYPTPGQTARLGQVIVLKSYPVSNLAISLPLAHDRLLVPKQYDGLQLPSSISRYDSIYGVYPVECESLNDPEKLLSEVSWWTAYNPERQRQLYHQELTKITGLQ